MENTRDPEGTWWNLHSKMERDTREIDESTDVTSAVASLTVNEVTRNEALVL